MGLVKYCTEVNYIFKPIQFLTFLCVFQHSWASFRPQVFLNSMLSYNRLRLMAINFPCVYSTFLNWAMILLAAYQNATFVNKLNNLSFFALWSNSFATLI